MILGLSPGLQLALFLGLLTMSFLCVWLSIKSSILQGHLLESPPSHLTLIIAAKPHLKISSPSEVLVVKLQHGNSLGAGRTGAHNPTLTQAQKPCKAETKD